MRVDSLGRPLYDQVCDAGEFAQALQKHFDWISCVPDSVFKSVLPALSCWHLATRENHAIGMAFGVKLGGKQPVVLIQNSGLGLSIDAILGTFTLYKQGLVLIVSQRGELSWEEIQHQDWGRISRGLTKECGFPEISFSDKGLESLAEAKKRSLSGEVVVLSIQRGNLNE